MPPSPRSRRRRQAGFTLIEVLLVTAIISSVPYDSYLNAQQKGVQTQCQGSLRQLGQLIQLYVDENEKYPAAAFYPKDPKDGADSLAKILGGDARLFVCPALPAKLQATGLNFVYNDALAGKKGVANPEKTWLLIEFTCVAADAPHPHPNGYNILYADGHVEATKELPPELVKLQQQAKQAQDAKKP